VAMKRYEKQAGKEPEKGSYQHALDISWAKIALSERSLPLI
jgi:hypothetical protein